MKGIDVLLRTKVRLLLVACSCVVLLQVMAMQTLGVGVATDSQRTNIVLCLASVCCLGWAGFSTGRSSPRPVVRVLALALCPVLLFIELFLVLGLTMPAGEVLAKFETGTASIVLYVTSLPLNSDSVLIQRQYRVLPGVHAYRDVAIIDPAWNPKVARSRDGQIVLTWDDDSGTAKSKRVWP